MRLGHLFNDQVCENIAEVFIGVDELSNVQCPSLTWATERVRNAGENMAQQL